MSSCRVSVASVEVGGTAAAGAAGAPVDVQWAVDSSGGAEAGVWVSGGVDAKGGVSVSGGDAGDAGVAVLF
eukprot:16513-Eustigmatos_ZCMA.PRE.1